MQISWHGQYTVKIISKETTIVLDPYSTDQGLSPFRGKADVVALSNPNDPSMSYTGGIQGEYLLINTPGEYSYKGYTLHSIGWNDEEGNERNLQRWLIDDMTVLHVGARTTDLSEQELREIERVDIDVLLLPIGGGNGLDTKGATKLITTIEPRIVIPIHYSLKGLKEKLDDNKAFAREMGVSATSAEKKVILKENKLPTEDMQIIMIAP